MHYKNGREAKNGDKVVVFSSYGAPMIGILYDAVAGDDTCNGKVAVTRSTDPMPNLQECLHYDDVKAAVEAKNVQPTDNPVDFGRAAYAAYCESRSWKSVRGEPLPQFQDQSPELQQAWRAAGAAVRAI